MEIVAEQGLADPATRRGHRATPSSTQNPDLDAIYVTWAEPAEFVLAALRNGGNTHTKIVTLDLSEPLALDMVKGGNVAAIVADEAYASASHARARRGRLADRQEARSRSLRSTPSPSPRTTSRKAGTSRSTATRRPSLDA